jgi:hypothetical protein
MKTLKAVNGQIACRPFAAGAGTATTSGPKKNNLALVAGKITLTPLEVVFGDAGAMDALGLGTRSLGVGPGAVVYVRGTGVAQPWAKDVQFIPDLPDPKDPSKALEFILVPIDQVVLVEHCECGDRGQQ